MTGPGRVVWEVTRRCVGACRVCASEAGAARPGELDAQEALGIPGELAAIGAKHVFLIGGEVWLREDWPALVREIRRQGMACSVVTSGAGLDEAAVEEAARAGVSSAVVSVDGLETGHELLRGAGSFARALRAISCFRERGIAVSVNTQVHRGSWRQLVALVQRLSVLGVGGWQPQLTVPDGRAAGEVGLLVQPFELLELMPALASAVERGRSRGLQVEVGDNLGYFGPYQGLFRGGPHHTRCGAGETVLGIDSDGTVKACASLPRSLGRLGLLREGPLSRMLEAQPSVAARRVEDLRGYCRECYYAAVCLGGCSWTAAAVSGAPGDNPYCHHRALELRARGRRERVVLRDGRPAVVVEPNPA